MILTYSQLYRIHVADKVTGETRPAERQPMTVNRILHIVAGAFILISLALAHYVSPKWLYFTAFVGVNLFQSGFTNWCLMETFLRKMGVAD